MSTTSAAIYISKVNEIYNEQPSYQLGHDGSDGTCDCIGMCRGALVRAGVTGITNMRGTNAAARKTIKNFEAFSSASQLKLGEVVLKAYEPGESGYNLPAAYQPGGASYNGDLRDYYHIGTVTQLNPLEITHMTSPSAKKDTKIGKWRFHGQLPWVDEGPGPDPDPPDPDPPSQDEARVTAPTGTTVNMRKGPGTNYKLVERVPIGSLVKILKQGDDWCRCAYTDQRRATWCGYMMTKFLDFDIDPGHVTQTYTVHVPFLTEEKANSLIRTYPGAWKTPDEGGDDNAVG